MNKQRSPHRAATGASQGGVTLLELMIVLVIVGILAAIGYPAYVNFTDRARRADGRALLLEAAARQERYFFDNNSYTDDATDLGYVVGAGGSGKREKSCEGKVCSAEGYYTLTIDDCGGKSATCFIVQATPNDNGGDADKINFTDDEPGECDVLSLDSRGAKGTSESTNADYVAKCWGS
ncbi:MAG: type IV pilin protein [Gammaproteobacteria bacterium]